MAEDNVVGCNKEGVEVCILFANTWCMRDELCYVLVHAFPKNIVINT